VTKTVVFLFTLSIDKTEDLQPESAKYHKKKKHIDPHNPNTQELESAIDDPCNNEC
jgi:hypothetical protein